MDNENVENNSEQTQEDIDGVEFFGDDNEDLEFEEGSQNFHEAAFQSGSGRGFRYASHALLLALYWIVCYYTEDEVLGLQEEINVSVEVEVTGIMGRRVWILRVVVEQEAEVVQIVLITMIQIGITVVMEWMDSLEGKAQDRIWMVVQGISINKHTMDNLT